MVVKFISVLIVSFMLNGLAGDAVSTIDKGQHITRNGCRKATKKANCYNLRLKLKNNVKSTVRKKGKILREFIAFYQCEKGDINKYVIIYKKMGRVVNYHILFFTSDSEVGLYRLTLGGEAVKLAEIINYFKKGKYLEIEIGLL